MLSFDGKWHSFKSIYLYTIKNQNNWEHFSPKTHPHTPHDGPTWQARSGRKFWQTRKNYRQENTSALLELLFSPTKNLPGRVYPPYQSTPIKKASMLRPRLCCADLSFPFLCQTLLFPWTLILSFLAASFLALIVGQPSPRRILLLHELQRSRLLGTSLLLDGSSCCMNCSVPETPSLPLGQSSPSTVPPPLLRVAWTAASQQPHRRRRPINPISAGDPHTPFKIYGSSSSACWYYKYPNSFKKI